MILLLALLELSSFYLLLEYSEEEEKVEEDNFKRGYKIKKDAFRHLFFV
jgi:hypothetical protein